MRLLLLLLLPVLVVSIVLNPEYVVKEYKKMKFAIQNFKHFCKYLDDKEDIYICREVLMNQLFPIPMESEVHMIRLRQGAFYEHNDRLVAHFHRSGVLLVPVEPNKQKAELENIKIEASPYASKKNVF
jgi:hypothetical protein